MTILRSTVDTSTAGYGEAYGNSLRQLAALDAELAKARAGGGPKYVERHRGRGKLLARERIELLLDRDSAFLELSPLAAWGSDYAVGASLVTGIGVVSGVECVVTANDPTVRGGVEQPVDGAQGVPGPRHRPGEPAAAGQPRRVRRRRPAEPGRDLHPRRAAVPGPDPAVRGRDPHGGAGLRQLHRRRRVRARDERPRGDGPGAVEGVPRRPAAGEDGHRRGRRRRVARRRGDARPRLRPGRPPRRWTSGTRCGSAGGSSPGSTGARPARARPSRRTSRATTRTSCSGSPAATCGCRSTRGRCWPGSWTAPGSTSTSRCTGRRC